MIYRAFVTLILEFGFQEMCAHPETESTFDTSNEKTNRNMLSILQILPFAYT